MEAKMYPFIRFCIILRFIQSVSAHSFKEEKPDYGICTAPNLEARPTSEETHSEYIPALNWCDYFWVKEDQMSEEL